MAQLIGMGAFGRAVDTSGIVLINFLEEPSSWRDGFRSHSTDMTELEMKLENQNRSIEKRQQSPHSSPQF